MPTDGFPLLEAVLLVALVAMAWFFRRRTPPRLKLGEHLVRMEHCTAEQRDHALEHQAELAQRGEVRWLGEIMIDLGYVRPYQVMDALRAQKREAELDL